jgi:light-regulated signal transduction histidine kinase (bacteriophytochrome)
MPEALLRRLRESLAEVFSNAVEHSDTTSGITACGQVYPKQRRLAFSVADLGIGIAGSYKRRYRSQIEDLAAIEWAVTGSNTTRRGPRPGGLGLKLIREFIELNRGRLCITSGTGYWEVHSAGIRRGGFGSPFPGTVVTVEIRTDDPLAAHPVDDVDPDDLW